MLQYFNSECLEVKGKTRSAFNVENEVKVEVDDTYVHIPVSY